MNTEENIINVDLSESLAPMYLNYAMSVIVDRALANANDGLKPVHRRILHGMNGLGLTHNKPYKKSARVIGEVLGKYHPHGDASVYEAAVILAQDFSTRYPLVDGHGNFGSVDGDSAAAMRYTEARLTKFGEALMNDINKNTVDFVPNYDGEEEEPNVLPTLLPVLLCNGSFGIAVGMSSNIPPHNLSDVYRACYKLIDDVKKGIDTDIEELIKEIKAPDFPTGGKIIGLKGVKEAYRKGEGSFILRGKHEIEETKNGVQIIITEIPYKVNKQKLCESIRDLSKSHKIAGIKEIRDESSKEGMRIVIEVKKGENPNIIVNNLIKLTSFQQNFNVKMIALVDKKPVLLNLKNVIENFLNHSANVIIRRTTFELERDSKRINLVSGLVKCLSSKEMLDKIIEIVRTEEDPLSEIMDLGFNKEQAEYILELKLRSLAKASAEKYMNEEKELQANIEKYNKILSSEEELLNQIESEFKELERIHGDERLTEISFEEGNIDEEDLIKEETLIVTYTTNGIIKAVEEKEYKAQKRGGKGVKGTNTKEDEIIKFMFTTSSKDDLLFFTTEGRCHVLKAFKIGKSSKAAKGRSINNYLNLNVGEKIVSVLNTNINNKDNNLLFITKKGQIKKLSLEQLSTRLSVTKVIGFKEGDSLVQALLVSQKDNVLIVTKNGMSLRIDTGAEGNKSIRPMGRSAAGVTGINLQNDDEVVDMCIVNDEDNIITVTELGIAKQTKASEWRIIGRGGKGVTAHGLSEKTGIIVSVLNSTENDELFIATEKGLIVRIKAGSIRICSRNATGVKAINLNDGDLVSSVSINKASEEVNEENE